MTDLSDTLYIMSKIGELQDSMDEQGKNISLLYILFAILLIINIAIVIIVR